MNKDAYGADLREHKIRRGVSNSYATPALAGRQLFLRSKLMLSAIEPVQMAWAEKTQ